jgi:hypothetical protein
MIEELVPDLRLQRAGALEVPACPALRRVILLNDDATPGTLPWVALLEAGQQVPVGEVTQRCAATDPRDGCRANTPRARWFPKGVACTVTTSSATSRTNANTGVTPTTRRSTTAALSRLVSVCGGAYVADLPARVMC